MDAVDDGLEPGVFVDHVLGSRDLAAIMQPGGHFQLFQLFVAQAHAAVDRPAIGVDRVGQGHGDERYAATVFAGMRRLVIDGRGNQAGQGVDQLEGQDPVVQQVEAATVGAGELLGLQQDRFEQPWQVALRRKGRADGVEPFDPLQQGVFVGPWRIPLRSVRPGHSAASSFPP